MITLYAIVSGVDASLPLPAMSVARLLAKLIVTLPSAAGMSVSVHSVCVGLSAGRFVQLKLPLLMLALLVVKSLSLKVAVVIRSLQTSLMGIGAEWVELPAILVNVTVGTTLSYVQDKELLAVLLLPALS